MEAETIHLSIIRELAVPDEASHKGENGRLLVVGGSERFHGALLLASTMAATVVDLVYVSSVPENNALIHEMKKQLPEFIAIPKKEIDAVLGKVDAVLVGPGLGDDDEARTLVNRLLEQAPTLPFVIDADGLDLVELDRLDERVIVTPHAGEFEQVFKLAPSAENARQVAEKFGCIVVLKGKKDIIASRERVVLNATGNAGMTKGGTGDVLAGLIAALSCTNTLFTAAAAGAYLNGAAGDRLQQTTSTYYRASELIGIIPQLIQEAQQSSP